MKVDKKTEEIQSELKEVQKEAEKEIKEAQKEVKGAKQEVKSLKSENEKLKELIVEIIQNQQSSRVREWINIACWILCFGLIIMQYVKG